MSLVCFTVMCKRNVHLLLVHLVMLVFITYRFSVCYSELDVCRSQELNVVIPHHPLMTLVLDIFSMSS